MVIFCLKIFFILNSVDLDEMQHCAEFHLGLHCLQKYPFSGFSNTKGLRSLHKWAFFVRKIDFLHFL